VKTAAFFPFLFSNHVLRRLLKRFGTVLEPRRPAASTFHVQNNSKCFVNNVVKVLEGEGFGFEAGQFIVYSLLPQNLVVARRADIVLLKKQDFPRKRSCQNGN